MFFHDYMLFLSTTVFFKIQHCVFNLQHEFQKGKKTVQICSVLGFSDKEAFLIETERAVLVSINISFIDRNFLKINYFKINATAYFFIFLSSFLYLMTFLKKTKMKPIRRVK